MASPLRGKAVIGQSGGPTSVINQSLVGAIEECSRSDLITDVYGALHGVDGILSQEFIDLGRQSSATLEAVANTPSAGLGSVRKKPTQEDCEKILEVFQTHGVRFFFYIGGNDSAEAAHLIDTLAREGGYECRIAHIPKTIDNDLLVTDHCPGFGSAGRFVALALMGDSLDNRALGGVKIDVTMGRDAGFLTAAAALGRQHEDDGPHLIYVPEVAFDVDSFCADVNTTMKTYGRCVVAVSEGIKGRNGEPIFTTGEVDSHGNKQLSGSGALGDYLADAVRKQLGVQRVRADTLGYLQRSFPGEVSAVDRKEAREVAVLAVRAIVTGECESGSAAIRRLEGEAYRAEYFMTELENVAGHTRSLPPEFIAPQGNDVTQAFLKYARPLVGELPRIGYFDKHAVPRSVVVRR